MINLKIWGHFMVAVVRISKKGNILEIKEVSDKYRYYPYKVDKKPKFC